MLDVGRGTHGSVATLHQHFYPVFWKCQLKAVHQTGGSLVSFLVWCDTGREWCQSRVAVERLAEVQVMGITERAPGESPGMTQLTLNSICW